MSNDNRTRLTGAVVGADGGWPKPPERRVPISEMSARELSDHSRKLSQASYAIGMPGSESLLRCAQVLAEQADHAAALDGLLVLEKQKSGKFYDAWQEATDRLRLAMAVIQVARGLDALARKDPTAPAMLWEHGWHLLREKLAALDAVEPVGGQS